MSTWPKGAWKAVRKVDSAKGDIYCAPACGSGCTFAAFELATKRAAELATQLGPEWEPVVHENMGWHYSVKSPCGRIRVHEYWRTPIAPNDGVIDKLGALVPDYYTAFVNVDGGGGGRWTGDGETPEEAVRDGVAKARAEYDAVLDMLTGVDPLVVALKVELKAVRP